MTAHCFGHLHKKGTVVMWSHAMLSLSGSFSRRLSVKPGECASGGRTAFISELTCITKPTKSLYSSVILFLFIQEEFFHANLYHIHVMMKILSVEIYQVPTEKCIEFIWFKWYIFSIWITSIRPINLSFSLLDSKSCNIFHSCRNSCIWMKEIQHSAFQWHINTMLSERTKEFCKSVNKIVQVYDIYTKILLITVHRKDNRRYNDTPTDSVVCSW